MAHNPHEDIVKANLEESVWKKRYQDLLEELQRQSAAEVAKNLSNIEGIVKKHSDQYDQAYAEFAHMAKERQRQLGMESYSTLILQMRPSLEAFSKLADEFKMYVTMRVWFGIRSNLNARDSIFLAGPDYIVQNMRAGCDWYLNTEGNFMEELPPVFVPYLADVDEKGILTVNLDVPNTQMTNKDKEEFVNKHSADFEESIIRWINGSPAPTGEPMEVRDTAEGRKIFINPGVDERSMTAEEFREFRTNTIQPALEDYFKVEFQPETPRNTGPGASA